MLGGMGREDMRKQNGGLFVDWLIAEDMEKTEKFLRLKTRKGKFLNVVREHYLRDDISCHSELCSHCINGK